MRIRFVLCSIAMLFVWTFFPKTSNAELLSNPTFSILFPKSQSVVGRRVNVVIDPTTDWSSIPFFQVVVGNDVYPVVDTSNGRHAVQGLLLNPGWNTISVRVLKPLSPPAGETSSEIKEQANLTTVSTESVTIFNREGYFGTIPEGSERFFFHDRDQEADCAGCHRLEVEKSDLNAKPTEVLCFPCHRELTNAKNIHGPAATWNCLGCHDPELYPVKYQFGTTNPWTVSKSYQPVEPIVFTLPADGIFKPQTAQLISTDVPLVPKKGITREKRKELIKARDDEINKRTERERELFVKLLEYLLQNPSDKLRVEAHVDDTVTNVVQSKNKLKKAAEEQYRKKLTDARAKSVAKLLKSYGISGKNIIAVGMGSGLPKVPNNTVEGRLINNRIEIVAHPPDTLIRNSMRLPQLKDRERVIVKLTYSAKARKNVKKLKFIEQLPRGAEYMKGTATIHGTLKEPKVKGNDLEWLVGDVSPGSQESISFVVKKHGDISFNPEIVLAYTMRKNEEHRVIDPRKPDKEGLTVLQTCEKCHEDVVSGSFRHGPAIAGYCTVCHDPHGSDYKKWLRKDSWDLCTTCHSEKATDVHVIAGFAKGFSHPTKKYRDPSRPGKRISCTSCHSPHSAETPELLGFGIKNKSDLCVYCHRKKM